MNSIKRFVHFLVGCCIIISALQGNKKLELPEHLELKLEQFKVSIKDKKNGHTIAWIEFMPCAQAQQVLNFKFQEPCKNCVFWRDIYVARAYRNKGLIRMLGLGLAKVLVPQGYKQVHWLAAPYKRKEYADGSYGPIIRTYDRELLDALVAIYEHFGAVAEKNADGTYRYVVNDYINQEAIPCVLQSTPEMIRYYLQEESDDETESAST